jgi:flagellar hook assembly protein FlgD
MPVPDMSIDVVGIRQPYFANISSSVFPNPFEQTTMISFRSGDQAIPQVSICDITGKTVRVIKPARSFSGNYNVEWNGENEAGQVVQPGYYFYQISGGDQTGGGKIVFSGR